MGIKINDKAVDFNLKDKDGIAYSLKDFSEDFLVIYFYPRDSTPGCTVEAVEFTSDLKKFENSNAKIIGISGGDEKSKKKFCENHSLKLLLLSDPDFKISKAYGSYGTKKFFGLKRGILRKTFILDSKRKVIKIYDKVKAAGHSEEVLGYIKSLQG